METSAAKKILIADDELRMLQGNRRLPLHQGIAVVEAEDGEQTLEIFCREHPI